MYRIIYPTLLSLAVAMIASVTLANTEYDSAKQSVEKLVYGVLNEVKQNKKIYENNEQQLFTLIEERVIPSVNVELFSKLVLGKYWKIASQTQRDNFINALKGTFVRSYGKSLILFSEVDKLTFLSPEQDDAPNKGKKKSYQMIASQMTFKGGKAPIHIKYSVTQDKEKWLIFDLVVDGLSIVQQFRRNYHREISEKGLQALITRLEETSK